MPTDSLALLMQTVPGVEALLLRHTASTTQQFVAQLYKDLDEIFENIISSRHLYQGDKFSEDLITIGIVNQLKVMKYDATHDTQHGGHCDILVRNRMKGFEWIGEAKLWKGPAYIKQGWDQLCSRYAPGTIQSNHGGILIYIDKPNALNLLTNWKTHIANAGVSGYEAQDIPSGSLYFDSMHDHESSGLKYNVRHFAIVMHHATSTNS